MNTKTWVARNLAAAMLAEEWTPRAMAVAARAALGERDTPDWLSATIAQILERTTTPYPPSPGTLARLILTSEAFQDRWAGGESRPAVAAIALAAPRFAPVPRFQNLGVPELSDLGALAAWLHLPASLLAWLADIESRRAFAPPGAARHYRYRWASRKSGSPRLIEAPKPILKQVQRQILHEILDRVPLGDCVHGFRKGRSCAGAAQLHAGEAVVVAIDLKDFFLSVSLGRIHGLFRGLGYPWQVARTLTALCSTVTPRDAIAGLPSGRALDSEAHGLIGRRHLPQGAPTSPALANLSAWRLDRRLGGLARRLDARYTRYGDDMAFSGDRDFARRAERFVPMVARICADSGLRINGRKTRIMGQGWRQRLLGLSVNQHVNIPRDRYERLKAVLHNCLYHGPAGQNRDGHPDFRAHLQGQVAWVESVNLRKGHRLRMLFEGIDWS